MQHMIEREEENPKDWLFAIHEILTKEQFDRLVVSLWAIWGDRRKAIHESIFQSPHSVDSFISSYLGELQVINAKTPAVTTQRRVNPRGWLASSAGNAKINVDVAVSRQGFDSIGVICRNHEGMFIGASTCGFSNIADPPTLEALAIREALALADDLYLRRVEVASDCKVVVEDLQHRYNC